ncbi:HAX1 protein, partial [Tricholaema leucomelas]|nr:HAX1 protein [Tricholaema leucomelas]
MSFYEAFRGFFGFPGRGRPRDPLFGGAVWDEEDEEDDDSPGLAQPPRDFGFTPGGSRGAFEELFRDMSELLGVFGGAWAGPPQPFEPSLPGAGAGAGGGGGGSGRSLRDSMLKHPDSSVPGAAPGGSVGTAE